MRRTAVRLALLGLGVALWAVACAQRGPLPVFQFTGSQGAQMWAPTHDISSIEATGEGMRISISGADPYSVGPARDYPAGVPLWMTIRLRSDQTGNGQVFYFREGTGPSEENSVHFPAKAGDWVEETVPLPPLGPRTHLRFDPPGVEGACTVAWIRFQTRIQPRGPKWPAPATTPLRAGKNVTSGDVQVQVDPTRLGSFAVRVAGTLMARGHDRPLIGYETRNTVRWLDVTRVARVTTAQAGGAITVRAAFSDPDGARWIVEQRFSPVSGSSQGKPGAIQVEARVTVSVDRQVLYLSPLTVLPGAGTFGKTKGHALFAGLEYMDAPDTSSSQADIEGPLSQRQVPDVVRMAFPLMAVQARGRYVALCWTPQPKICPVFDSPDRLFGSGGHVMGLLFPGSDGRNRQEGKLLPYHPTPIRRGQPLVVQAVLLGGKGESVVPAVQQYVAIRGLPPVPDTGLGTDGYVKLAAGGWLDSKIGEDGRYRHAYWPGSSFQLGLAADAPVWMEWLAGKTKDTVLADRLREQAKTAITLVSPADYNAAGVSHVRYPVPALIYGDVEENVVRAVDGAHESIGRFEPDGTLLYKPTGTDFGRTHFERHANGLASPVVSSILQAAALSGDPDLLRDGIRLLHGLDRYLNTAPRGAQTWEVPLHTPDILASAYLVKAYTLGYELTGDRKLLDAAAYWAWTGVPFVYLWNPTDQPIGPYATTAVFGATFWKAPDWMGQPVQWCGLVYSDALYRLARFDSSGPWRKLADGITASGIQQSWPSSDRDLQGLLPDSVNLRPQTRNPVAINPGTVQANAAQMVGGPAIYDFHAFRKAGLCVHAPGAIADARDASDGASFRVAGWVGRPYYVLIAGLKGKPTITVDGQPAVLTAPNEWHSTEGRAVLHVVGSPRIEVKTR